jgi:Kef-type K+ transport system membrane component KefB
MDSILIIGIVILTGFVFGELVERIRLPRITGYVIAGIILNPKLSGLVPSGFTESTSPIVDICLSVITFAVGGELLFSRLKTQERRILAMTVFEAELAFAVVFAGLLLSVPLLTHFGVSSPVHILPVCLVLGSLAGPTDPAAALAVTKEYKSKGEVSATVIGIAAHDDALTFLNYAVATKVAALLLLGSSAGIWFGIAESLIHVVGGLLLGAICGFLFNLISKLTQREGEGVLFVELIGLLALCFGTASYLGVDRLLSTMAMGIIVVNFNDLSGTVFRILERYTEELVFVLFFTLSGMYLDFSAAGLAAIPVGLFVVFRSIGKLSGAALGASISGSSHKVRRYTGWALIPQGGIVIGLALLLRQNEAFQSVSDFILAVVIGATVVHEIIGPPFVKLALSKAGEIGD